MTDFGPQSRGLVQYIESTWAELIPPAKERELIEAAVAAWAKEGKIPEKMTAAGRKKSIERLRKGGLS